MTSVVRMPDGMRQMDSLQQRIERLELAMARDEIYTSIPTEDNYEGRQIVLKVAADTMWDLVYSSTTGDAYPWIVIGGPALYSAVAAGESTASTSYTDLATVGPSLDVPFIGAYDISVGALLQTASIVGNAAVVSFAGPSFAASDDYAGHVTTAAAAPTLAYSEKTTRIFMSAAGTVAAKYRSSTANPGTITAHRRRLIIRPVRLGSDT